MHKTTDRSQIPAHTPTANPKRTNQGWLDELFGQRGLVAQQQAHLDLANYLYVVAYNYLLGRQSTTVALTNFAVEELAALAQDFVQDTLEKLSADHFARLRQYRATGRFSSWTAQIIRNHIAGELRKAPFTHHQLDLSEIENQPTSELTHDVVVEQQEVTNALQACIQRLPEHYQVALCDCIAEGQPAQAVATLLQKNVGAIYLLVMRAKRLMKECLESKGIGKEVLRVFS